LAGVHVSRSRSHGGVRAAISASATRWRRQMADLERQWWYSNLVSQRARTILSGGGGHGRRLHDKRRYVRFRTAPQVVGQARSVCATEVRSTILPERFLVR
jgi:hypothetical protein